MDKSLANVVNGVILWGIILILMFIRDWKKKDRDRRT